MPENLVVARVARDSPYAPAGHHRPWWRRGSRLAPIRVAVTSFTAMYASAISEVAAAVWMQRRWEEGATSVPMTLGHGYRQSAAAIIRERGIEKAAWSILFCAVVVVGDCFLFCAMVLVGDWLPCVMCRWMRTWDIFSFLNLFFFFWNVLFWTLRTWNLGA